MGDNEINSNSYKFSLLNLKHFKLFSLQNENFSSENI